MGKPRKDPRKATAKAAAKKTTRKVDVGQNIMIKSLTKRLTKLEGATIERRYLTMTDAFSFGGLGQVKSRQLHRYNTGTYDGMTTAALFGTTAIQGDYVFARYMIVDIEIQCQNPNLVIGDEISPTTYSIYLMKARKGNDLLFTSGGPADYAVENALNDPEIITQNVAGQSFVNPKGFKVVKSKRGVIGGVNADAGFGIAHRRYRFTIPINKRILLQPVPGADTTTNYPQSVQDWLWFAICANGSSTDGNEPHCSLSCMLCFDDAGSN